MKAILKVHYFYLHLIFLSMKGCESCYSGAENVFFFYPCYL